MPGGRSSFANDVQLVIAGDHALALAVAQIDLEDRGEEVAGVDQGVEGLVIQADRLRGFSASVNHARYAVVTANAAGGPLAGARARRGRERLVRCHVDSPLQKKSAPSPPGVSEWRAPGL
jgi:hypothetical protein